MNIFQLLKIYSLKVCIQTIGQWSNGIRLASQEGFTSGKMLDYIYQDKPGGKYLIGKFLDSLFIHHQGWQDIRIRKSNLIAALKEAIELTLKSTDHVHIVDVASGPARYILETLTEFQNKNVTAEIRDIDERWLKEATTKAEALGLHGLTSRTANALDAKDFVFTVQPNIMVSSGFYDWFSDDTLVQKSMQLIYDALPVNGYFVFTNQSGHVDLTTINKVFKDFNNQQLQMTVRQATLVNSWAEAIGFKILTTKTDQNQRYSISLAIKPKL